MDLLNKMTTYVRVIESGSFTSAARQLRISSAAVSRQIATLEEQLGASLLERTTRKMTVTVQGRHYYEQCLRILREVEVAHAMGAEDNLGGIVRITAPVTFGLACVVPQMATFMKNHPGLVVELRLEDRVVDLTPEGFDVAIRVGVELPASTELVARRLVTYPRTLVASPRYLKQNGEPRRPEALARHDTLMHFMGPTDTWTLRQGDIEARVRPRVVFRSNALHALRELALKGAGITLLPKWLAAPDVSSGQLREVLPSWRSEDITANAIYRKDQRGALRVKTLIDHLRSSLASLDDVARRPNVVSLHP